MEQYRPSVASHGQAPEYCFLGRVDEEWRDYQQ